MSYILTRNANFLAITSFLFQYRIMTRGRHEYRNSVFEWNGILVEFWNGIEWNTENLEYYSNIWSVFRNTIRILEKRRYSEIPGKMVLEQYSGILMYCQTKYNNTGCPTTNRRC